MEEMGGRGVRRAKNGIVSDKKGLWRERERRRLLELDGTSILSRFGQGR